MMNVNTSRGDVATLSLSAAAVLLLMNPRNLVASAGTDLKALKALRMFALELKEAVDEGYMCINMPRYQLRSAESELIEGPICINLYHRLDRERLIEEEFRKLEIKDYFRFPAIYTPGDGATGCLESHIKALEHASSSDRRAIWICEDDIEFKVDRDTMDACIDEFMKSDAEILCLGYISKNEVAYSNLLNHSKDIQTTSCYIIKPAFCSILINFWKSILEYRKAKKDHHPYKQKYIDLDVFKSEYEVADQSWKVLQQSHIFVIPKTHYVIQRYSYSDIDGRHRGFYHDGIP